MTEKWPAVEVAAGQVFCASPCLQTVCATTASGQDRDRFRQAHRGGEKRKDPPSTHQNSCARMGSGALLPRCADHAGWALLTSGASGHGCFLAVKPNQPEDDGEYGVPDVALPNVALPIARGQRGCLTENPQYAHPLVSSVSVILPNFLCELQT